MIWLRIFTFLFFWVSLGCIHYPRSTDDSFYSSVQKTPYSISLNFYKGNGTRIDESKTAKAISSEFKKAGVFRYENLNYDDYLNSENLITDCHYSVEQLGVLGGARSELDGLSVFIPFPVYTEEKLLCSLSTKAGVKKTYNSTFRYSTYYFVYFVPFGIIHWLAYPSTYPEQILAQDILKQIKDDLSPASLTLVSP